MLRFSFCLDEIAPEMVTESTAFYWVDGTLRLSSGTGIVFEEAGVPLVELAVWLSYWLASSEPVNSFLPEGYDEDYGPMLQLASTGSTQYQLTYTSVSITVVLTVERNELETTFTQFLQNLSQTLQQQYGLSLDAVLLRYRPSL